jgi:cephalosporin hydroxylase
MGRLTDIANRQETDKGTEHFERHGYTEIYDQYIPEAGKYKLLEIGIYHGDSLRMWEEYNPELEIHALDIDENINRWIQQPNPYHIYIGDQTNPSMIDEIAKKGGPFDFIIDDGSHVGQHITASFKMLWQHLKPGGYYFIEDLHAGHANRQETIKIITEFLSDGSYFMTLVNDAKLLIIEKR